MNRDIGRLLLTVALVGAMGGCAGGGPVDPQYRAGRTIYRSCAHCHGPQGEGGAGPSLADVRTTFPDCADHQRWIALGSVGWEPQVGQTYGEPGHPVAGGMPGFGDELSEEQIAQTALYERVRFGGAELTSELAACGLGATE